MEVSFNLSLTNNELLEFDGNNYSVQKSFTTAEIPDKLELCKQMLYQNDPFYVFEYFHVFYAVIEQKNTDDSHFIINLSRAFDIIFITMNQLRTNLTKFLEVNKPLDPQERVRYLNLTKMCLFLLINIVRKIEENNMIFKQHEEQQFQKQDEDPDKEEGDQVKKQQKNQDAAEGKHYDKYADWASKRGKFLIQLYNVMQLPLEKLWHPGTIDANFVNLVCDACYNILEKLHMSSNGPQVLNTIFQIFDLAITRYNHGINFPIGILRILRNTENTGRYVVFGFNLLIKNGRDMSQIFPILIKEILESLSMDTGFSRISRNYSRFLMELSYCAPKLFIPHLHTFCYDLLACKYNGLRSSILRIIGDVVLRNFSGKELCENKKKIRNEYLGHLFMHIKDISYQVRAEVLQIWNCLNERKVVPLFLYTKIFSAAVERLDDRIASVRMQAMQMIVTCLENNPFCRNLTINELKERIAEELIKMNNLKKMVLKEQKKANKIEKEFCKITPKLLPHIKEIINSKQNESNMGYEELIQCIPKMLKEKKYNEVVATVYKSDHGKPEVRLQMDFEAQCNYFLLLIKAYALMGSDYKDNNKQLVEQIKIVKNLEYSLDFYKFLVQVMPKLMETFSYKTLTDNISDSLDTFKLEQRIKQCLKAYAIQNTENANDNASNKRTKFQNGKKKAASASKKNVRNKNRKRF